MNISETPLLQKNTSFSCQLSGILGEIFCEIYNFNQAQVLFNLSWCVAHQLGIQLSLYFCENFHKKSELDTVWLIFGGISHVSKIIPYKIWRIWSKCFQDFSFFYHYGCLTVCFICFILQKENIKMKMLNFFLTTVFIL